MKIGCHIFLRFFFTLFFFINFVCFVKHIYIAVSVYNWNWKEWASCSDTVYILFEEEQVEWMKHLHNMQKKKIKLYSPNQRRHIIRMHIVYTDITQWVPIQGYTQCSKIVNSKKLLFSLPSHFYWCSIILLYTSYIIIL